MGWSAAFTPAERCISWYQFLEAVELLYSYGLVTVPFGGIEFAAFRRPRKWR